VTTGGVVKKTVLAAGAMTAAAAVCYPREATEISKYSWNVASDFAATTYHDLFDCKSAQFQLQQHCDVVTEQHTVLSFESRCHAVHVATEACWSVSTSAARAQQCVT